jgi:hypothetical protein
LGWISFEEILQTPASRFWFCVAARANLFRLKGRSSTPRAFETRRTGVSIDPSGFEETELEGFIDYGSPIRTVVPVYNEKGELVGTAVQEHPNPILQPVFRTIRKE